MPTGSLGLDEIFFGFFGVVLVESSLSGRGSTAVDSSSWVTGGLAAGDGDGEGEGEGEGDGEGGGDGLRLAGSIVFSSLAASLFSSSAGSALVSSAGLTSMVSPVSSCCPSSLTSSSIAAISAAAAAASSAAAFSASCASFLALFLASLAASYRSWPSSYRPAQSVLRITLHPSLSIGGPSPPSMRVLTAERDGAFQLTGNTSTEPVHVSKPASLLMKPSSHSHEDVDSSLGA